MRRFRRYFLGAMTVFAMSVCAASLQSCASTGHSMPTPAKLIELGIVDAGADVESLKRGRTLAIMDCRACHRQYWPQEFRTKRWARLSENMGRLAALRNDQIDDLMQYMIAASKTTEAEATVRQSRATNGIGD